jgi:hypothetical protein
VGAGRVEDAINLLGHALGKVVGVLARQQGGGLAEGTRALAERARVAELAASSLKAALDLDTVHQAYSIDTRSLRSTPEPRPGSRPGISTQCSETVAR